MKKYGKIQITQEDIDCGVKGDALHCAVSAAFRRILPEEKVIVTTCLSDIDARYPNPTTFIETHGRTRELRYGYEVRQFLTAFDDGKEVTPTTLEYYEEVT